MVDTHLVASLPPKRKPDITIYERAMAPSDVIITEGCLLPSAYYIVALGDVKELKTRASGFADEELGELNSFLCDLMIAQPGRTLAVGFLTDGANIQFLVLRKSKDNESINASLTPCYRLLNNGKKPTEGALYLHGLLQLSTSALGAHSEQVMVDNLPVAIGDHLGIGSVSSVWAGQLGGADIVVKFYRKKADLNQERSALKRLAQRLQPEHRKLVSQLKGEDAKAGALAIIPHGRAFARTPSELARGRLPHPQPRHYVALVEILEAVHTQVGLVHRDLAPRNFFLHPAEDFVCSACFGLYSRSPGLPERLGQRLRARYERGLLWCARVRRQ